MLVSAQDIHYKTVALESVLSTLIAGLSVNNPGLVGEIKRTIDENIEKPNQPEGLINALMQVRDSINSVTIVPPHE